MSNKPAPLLLSTTAEVIDALGGSREVAEIFAFPEVARVSNWKRGKFPAATYKALSQILKERRIAYSEDLWAWFDIAPRDSRTGTVRKDSRSRRSDALT